MQSMVLPLSPSLSLLKPQTRFFSASQTRFSAFKLNANASPFPRLASSSSKRASLLPISPSHSFRINATSFSTSSSSSSSSSSFSSSSSSSSSSFSTSSSSSSSSDSSNSSLFKTLELGALLGLWMIFNIYCNIYNNKGLLLITYQRSMQLPAFTSQVLKVYYFPSTLTAIQFAAGTLIVLFMWGFNLYKRPKITPAQLAAIVPLAIVHTLGNLFTNMSLGKVAVSFSHTIKAMEPFFSVILSAMFLGEMPTAWVVASLVPVVGGVGLASFTEASFNWAGFWSAMASSLSNQSRNVLSKKLMVKKEVSSMILERVSPVTHSVANYVKRVVVIVSTVIFFQTPVSPINAFWTAIALANVFLYSMVNRIKPKTA